MEIHPNQGIYKLNTEIIKTRKTVVPKTVTHSLV